MRELAGTAAFVTGGASGIGFALGRAFAEAGMQVMLADIETDALAAVVKSLHNFGLDVRGITCDVADPVSVERAAKARARRSEMSTWFAIMLVSAVAAALTILRWRGTAISRKSRFSATAHTFGTISKWRSRDREWRRRECPDTQ